MRVQPATHSQRSLALWPSVDGPVSGFPPGHLPAGVTPPEPGRLNGERIGGLCGARRIHAQPFNSPVWTLRAHFRAKRWLCT